ncbi:hypothetical protein GCM10009716_18980 [Streptomyces sodiiphilus]|uniref:Sigma-70 family RNA polymerase sigma factor n=1 Tax=Streptomyces sodiiphilus TaxID=226217 RepID=A0ABN2P3F8_9ACTN
MNAEPVAETGPTGTSPVDAVDADSPGSGPPTDFDAFFQRSFPGMLARAILLSGHRQDAEDAVQEAYTEALRRWERLRGYDSPEGWVHRVVRQRLSSVSRRAARTRPTDLEDLPQLSVAGADRSIEARAVLDALAALPPRQRTVLVLHSLEGMSQEAVARELGLTRGGVAAGLFKARRKLEKVLDVVEHERETGRRTGRDTPHRDRDGLVSRPPQARPLPLAGAGAAPPADGPDGAVARTELWLRGRIAARPDLRDRLRDAVLASAGRAETGPRGQERAAPDGDAEREHRP